MRITFIDLIGWDYDVETPYQKPLGGSQSALCYLSAALAEMGHTVSLVNHTRNPGLHRNVDCRHRERTPESFYREQDVVIVLNAARFGGQLRSLCGPETRIVLWTQHADDQDDIRQLAELAEKSQYDAIACVSEWQRERYRKAFALGPKRLVVKRNAIGPAFRGLFSPTESILEARADPPVLVYTSTPFRGLELLPDFFPRVREAFPGTRLKIFSSMKVYQSSATVDAQFSELYRRCHETEGVELVGSIDQPRLAAELKSAAALAYPNTFAETSCISVMEALAAGCSVVTSEYAALPETSAGYARLIPVPRPDRLTLEMSESETGNYGDRFVEEVLSVLERASGPDRESEEARLREQVDHFNTAGTWQVRAAEWSDWLEGLERRTAPPLASVQINFSGRRSDFFHFDTDLGRLVTSEVLQGQSYPELPFPLEATTIADIGANVGAAAVYFAVKYPQARIYSWEPSPTSSDLLFHNTSAFPTITCFNYGLSDHDGSSPLYLGIDDSVTDSLGDSRLNSEAHVSVDLREAAAVMNDLGLDSIDILKLDTEGNELPIMRSLAPMLARIAVIYIEFHRAEDRLEIDEILSGTHLLFNGRVTSPHRGELCYVSKNRLPDEVHELRIAGPADAN